jgi:hypothetical protein
MQHSSSHPPASARISSGMTAPVDELSYDEVEETTPSTPYPRTGAIARALARLKQLVAPKR